MNKHYTFQEYLENFSSIQDSYDYYFEQQKEIDRLNNIINELEKWVDEYPSEDVWYEHITNKLKELKENK
jgi:hypothetical protein